MKKLAYAGAVALALSMVVGHPAEAVVDAGDNAEHTHRESYLVGFAEPGVLRYRGGVPGLAATSPSAREGGTLDLDSPAVRAYSEYLESRRTQHLASIAGSLARAPELTHSYAIIRNGVALKLTAREAVIVAELEGVSSVRKAGIEHLHTFRGPAFIGAHSIWDGSATPTGIGTRGQGVVVGVIDSGTASGHPSLANDPSCGHSAAEPKLISAVDCSASSGGICNGPNPEANLENGHGVHVASTAVGNVIDASVVPPPALGEGQTMSGVAPCARVRSYKVCETNSCDGAAIMAAIENAIADSVDVINYSISGGTEPWAEFDFDRAFLDAVGAGILVAAAAGNTGPNVPDPVGRVNHLGPWVATVAASTHDMNASSEGSLSVQGPGTVPPLLQNLPVTPGVDSLPAGALDDVAIRFDPDNALGCAPYTPAYFDGAIAVISRGDCTFHDKIEHAADAGAMLAVIFNNEPGPIGIVTAGASIPAYATTQSAGLALTQFIASNAPADAIADFAPAAVIADMLADFSLRGPTSAAYRNLLKPDISAPGVNIYAAMDPATHYGYMSGTSMASPHVAGAMALLRSTHPDWTPMEIKSALQTTAIVTGVKDDGVSPWDADDVGSGRADLTKAALAGLVLDETYENFLAANPVGGSIDPKALNLSSMRDVECTPQCTFTRTVTNRLAAAGTWTAEFLASAPGAFSAEVEPESFTLAPGESQVLVVSAKPANGAVMSRIGFGGIRMIEVAERAPPQHLTLAIKGQGRQDYIDVLHGETGIADQCASSGTSNGVIEPGETAALSIPLAVIGQDFPDVTARLALPAPDGVTYVSSIDVLGDLNAGEKATAQFQIRVDDGNACLSEFVLPIVFISSQDEFRAEVPVKVGLASDDMFLPGNLPMPIPDGNTAGIGSPLEVLQSIDLKGLEVEANIDHNWVGDLRIVLRSPAGTEVVLLDRPGHPASSFGCGNRQVNVRFDDDALDPEGTCAAGQSAIWPVQQARPVQPLSAFDGENAKGIWTLKVLDDVGGYSGRIMNWRLLPQPAFEGICTVCEDADDVLFADGFEGA